MSGQPKVLMVLNDIAWFWSHRTPLAKGILNRGWALSVATARAKSDSGLKDMGVKAHDLPEHDSSLNPLKQICILHSLYTIIKNEQPDIIHAITVRYAFYTGLVTRAMNYGPVVLTIAGLGTLFSGQSVKAKILRIVVMPLFRLAFHRDSVFIIFQNRDDREAMLNAKAVTPDQTVIIRGSGVDLGKFPIAPIPKTDKPIVLFCSRLIREKGIEEFVEAARMLKAKGISARFQVAGDIYAKNPDSLSREEVQTWHDEGIIEWLGQCDDMPGVFAASSIVTLPSYYREGVPKVLLEAMAMGRPIVTTDLPGCRETVEDGVNGFLIPGRNAQALANALEKLILNHDQCVAFGKMGRQMVEKDFRVESVVTRTLDVYDRMMKM